MRIRLRMLIIVADEVVFRMCTNEYIEYFP